MMHANNSLKNNRSLLSKRKGKTNMEGSYADIELKEFPEASKEQLKAIRKQTIKENRERRLKHIALWVLVIGLLLIVFAFI